MSCHKLQVAFFIIYTFLVGFKNCPVAPDRAFLFIFANNLKLNTL